MATTTQQDPRIEQLEELKQRFLDTHAALVKAQAAGDKKLVLSLGAKKANRQAEIRNLRLDLMEDGIRTEWTPPATTRSKRQRKPAPSQEAIEAQVTKTFNVYKSETDEEMKGAADARITTLLKVAAKEGYKVQDPRKAKS